MEDKFTEKAVVDRPLYFSYRNSKGFMVIFPNLRVLNFSTGEHNDNVSYLNLLPASKGSLGKELTQFDLDRIKEVHDAVPYDIILPRLNGLISILNEATKEMHTFDGDNILSSFEDNNFNPDEVPY